MRGGLGESFPGPERKKHRWRHREAKNGKKYGRSPEDEPSREEKDCLRDAVEETHTESKKKSSRHVCKRKTMDEKGGKSKF